MSDEQYSFVVEEYLKSSIMIILSYSSIRKNFKPFDEGLISIAQQLTLQYLYQKDVMQMAKTFNPEDGKIRTFIPSVLTKDIQNMLNNYLRVTGSNIITSNSKNNLVDFRDTIIVCEKKESSDEDNEDDEENGEEP